MVAAIVKWYNRAMVMLSSEFNSRWWQNTFLETLMYQRFLTIENHYLSYNHLKKFLKDTTIFDSKLFLDVYQ